MSPRREGRTEHCDASDAEARLRRAKTFLEVAGVVQDESDADFWSVAASLAVLAGIAASDAACCRALSRRSRGDSHHDAETLLKTITGGGQAAAQALRRLIDLKDKAQYGIIHVSQDDLKTAMNQAGKLVAFAESVHRR